MEKLGQDNKQMEEKIIYLEECILKIDDFTKNHLPRVYTKDRQSVLHPELSVLHNDIKISIVNMIILCKKNNLDIQSFKERINNIINSLTENQVPCHIRALLNLLIEMGEGKCDINVDNLIELIN